MKRVFIVLKDITESGGGERVCVNLANALNERGYEITIISFFKRHEAIAFHLDSKIQVIFLSNTSTNTKNPLKKLYLKSLYRRSLCAKTDSMIQAQKPNAVLANDGWYIPQKRVDSVNKDSQSLQGGVANKAICNIESNKQNMDCFASVRNDTALDSINYVRLWHLKAPKKINSRKRRNFAKFDTLVVLSKSELNKWNGYHHNVKVIPKFSTKDFRI